MPIVTFDVESYTVSAHEQMQSTTGSYRTLALVSTALAHGIRTRATIFFFDTASATSGVVTNVDQPNFEGQRAYAYCRKPDFPGWYDLLRNEQPLKCTYAYDGAAFDANTPSRSLYWIQLYTGVAEPPGEGPEEVQNLMLPVGVLEVLHGASQRAASESEQ
jgi:hypothetical protein